MARVLALVAAATASPCWAYRDGVGGISEHAAWRDALVTAPKGKWFDAVRGAQRITPQAKGMLTAPNPDEAGDATSAPSEQDAFAAVWRKPCAKHCKSLREGCPDRFCESLTATMGMLSGNNIVRTQAIALAFLDAGVPAAQEAGLSKEIVPTLGVLSRATDRSVSRKAVEYLVSLFASGYSEEVWHIAMVNGAVRLGMSRNGIQRACRAGHCKDVVHMLPFLANDTTNKFVRRQFALNVVDAVCRAGYCDNVTHIVKRFALDDDYKLREFTAQSAFPAICMQGARVCQEVLPDILAQSRREDDFDLLRKLLAFTLPPVCAAGLFKEVSPFLNKMVNDWRLMLSTPAQVTLSGCKVVEAAQRDRDTALNLLDKVEMQKIEAVKEKNKSLELVKELEVQKAAALKEKDKSLELVKALEVQKTEAVKANNRSLALLEDLEVEKIKASTLEKEANLKIEEASRAQEMAVNAKADMAAAAATAQLNAERALSEDLKGKLWGCAVALAAAMVPVIVAGVSWIVRQACAPASTPAT